MSLVGFRVADSHRPNPWHRIAKIAARLNVQPIEGRTDRSPSIVVSGAEFVPLSGGVPPNYDLLGVVEALLDRLDKAVST